MDKIKRKMLRANTPIEDYLSPYGLWVKREDLSCRPPGPPFSKARGVYERVKSRPEKIIGVLDTAHSQAGHAVAQACKLLNKRCWNFYPVYKKEGSLEEHELREAQRAAKKLRAAMKPLAAGRSCILFHAARKLTEKHGGYMMPNALKLEESVEETAKEVPEEYYRNILIPISSGTIAKGVIQGVLAKLDHRPTRFILHLGYSRSHDQVRRYVSEGWKIKDKNLVLVDEGYNYKDVSKDRTIPPWPCNRHYDLKAFHWWLREGQDRFGQALLWNIG